MGKRSKISGLPADVKKWLDRVLVEGNFSDYRNLSDELKRRGYLISKSSVHEYGKSFQEKLDALQMASLKAKAIVEASPDDENAITQALIRLTQERLFDLLMVDNDGDEDAVKINLAAVAKAVAQLSRADVTLKRFVDEVRLKTVKAAENVENQVRAAGLSEEAVENIRREILGIA